MRFVNLLAVSLALSACADMTPSEKYWAAAAMSVVSVGAVSVYRERHDQQISINQRRSFEPVDCSNPATCK
jgi:hypothetical protein